MITHPDRTPSTSLRVAIWGDLHCEESVIDWYPDKLRAAQDASAEHRPDLILQLGDIMGGHDTAHLWTPAERRAYLPILRRFSETAPAIFLQGNHDGEADWHTALSATFPIRVATDPGPIRVVPGDRPVYVWCLPFPHRGHMAAGRTFPSIEVETATLEAELKGLLEDWGAAITELREDEPGSVHIVATHASWNGAAPGGGEIFQPGGDITVSPADLAATGADLVVGGHIHGPQVLAPRLLLAGSCRHLGHGESGDSRYHWIVDIDRAPRQADFDADGERLQFVFSDDRGSVVATGLPTGAPKWLTVKARWNGFTVEADPLPPHVVGAQVRVEIETDEAHRDTMPGQAAVLAAVLGDTETFGTKLTTRVQRPEREIRAPEILNADREEPIELLKVWSSATRGKDIGPDQEKRIRRNIEDKLRDPIGELVAEFPGVEGLIRGAV